MSSNGARLEKETPHSEAAAADDNRWPRTPRAGSPAGSRRASFFYRAFGTITSASKCAKGGCNERIPPYQSFAPGSAARRSRGGRMRRASALEQPRSRRFVATADPADHSLDAGADPGSRHRHQPVRRHLPPGHRRTPRSAAIHAAARWPPHRHARGYGRSEEVIGTLLTELGNRDRFFIATKPFRPRRPMRRSPGRCWMNPFAGFAPSASICFRFTACCA